jgi:hypothetical protein
LHIALDNNPLMRLTLSALLGDKQMNKYQQREIKTLETMHALGGYEQNIAQALSFLIRAALTKKSREALMQYAHTFNVVNHPSFII